MYANIVMYIHTKNGADSVYVSIVSLAGEGVAGTVTVREQT